MSVAPQSVEGDPLADRFEWSVRQNEFEQRLRAALAMRRRRRCSLVVVEATGGGDCLSEVLVELPPHAGSERASAFALGADRFALLLPNVDARRAAELARTLELRLAFRSEGTVSAAIGVA